MNTTRYKDAFQPLQGEDREEGIGRKKIPDFYWSNQGQARGTGNALFIHLT